MKKIGTLFIGISLFAVIITTAGLVWNWAPTTTMESQSLPSTKFGAFLAAQHAVYINDFDSAREFTEILHNTDIGIVQNTILLTEFLGGRIPDGAADLKDSDNAPMRFIYDAMLIEQGDWQQLYKRHKTDTSPLSAPIRIWSGIAVNHITDTFKFIDGLPTNDAWKSFVRGQIYAYQNKIDDAMREFARVPADFMNINDFLYVMAFYEFHNKTESAYALRDAFTAGPGGMYMLNFDLNPKWADYTGLENNLAFGLVQNVSHTSVMMYSDLSLLLLRFAGIARGETDDAINYYLGLYFFTNGGDYKKYFDAIPNTSPFYAFAKMKVADASDTQDDLEQVVNANPLFVPAIDRLVAKNIQTGNRRGALHVIDSALDNDNLTPFGRAFLLKTRSRVYLAFGDLKDAQTDIRAAADILTIDPQILSIQARIWAEENRELETAYEYAMALVNNNPADVGGWDILGRVVRVREGTRAAMDIIEKVGQVSNTCSSLFEQLGDLYIKIGNTKNAVDAYQRAIALSDDGLVVVPQINKKLRDLK